ncbi:hypothetical protein Cfor_12550 [Coptotermes formosanus]|uniref:Centriolar and ciliogenesis-associated protein HYLS1 C-terminal domain-containing protein n=1 Tax=Coptotermes formosanus TaxID=36987 RepID=A0A6L2Q805_COPFO|nr:hypothetical protein Cfor_12550 [Coptotermes formosanus]
MTIKLDPKEVRAHLHRLGYCNITGEQLKDFIKDLKKLIKYDQHLLCTCKESNELSGSSYIETSPETFRTSNSTSLRTGNEYSHEEGHKIADTHEHMKQKYVTCTRSLVHTVQSDDISGRTSCSTALPNTSEKTKKLIHFSKEKQCRMTGCMENLQEPVKPKSSFIRPWNINPRQTVGAPKRCDPVKLYHHYQDIWRQQKVPGEDNHYELRWSVRERMLSEDPHPRPISRASSTRALSKQHRVV